jgi:hypothetical protein
MCILLSVSMKKLLTGAFVLLQLVQVIQFVNAGS